MTNFFESERARRDVFIEIMSQVLGIHLYPAALSGTNCMTDGHAVTTNGEVYIISKAKKELGVGTADPLYESAWNHLKYVRTRPGAESILPCLHVYYAGELGRH